MATNSVCIAKSEVLTLFPAQEREEVRSYLDGITPNACIDYAALEKYSRLLTGTARSGSTQSSEDSCVPVEAIENVLGPMPIGAGRSPMITWNRKHRRFAEAIDFLQTRLGLSFEVYRFCGQTYSASSARELDKPAPSVGAETMPTEGVSGLHPPAGWETYKHLTGGRADDQALLEYLQDVCLRANSRYPDNTLNRALQVSKETATILKEDRQAGVNLMDSYAPPELFPYPLRILDCE